MSPKRAVLRILVTMLFCVLSSGMFAQNMIRNGSMEEGEGNPANWGMWGWQMKNAEFKLESGAAHTGSRFATIINNENNDARFIQEVLVQEGKKYKISGWIKTENVGIDESVKGASISLLEGAEYSSPDIKGTNGQWEPVAFYLEVGAHMIKVTVSLGVGGYGKVNTGKASFDDVEMVEVSSVPAGSSLVKIEGKPENVPPPPQTNTTVSNVSTNKADPPKDKGGSNVMLVVIIILVVVIIVTIVILLVLPKDKNEPTLKDEKGDKK